MDVQCPFRISQSNDGDEQWNLSDFIFSRIACFELEVDKPAMCDPERGVTWLFSEIQEWTNNCRCRLLEAGVTSRSKIALVTSNTARVVLVQLAASQIGCIVVCINGWASSEEIYHQIESVECSHCIVETQFMGKLEETRRRTSIKGLGNCRTIKNLDEVVCRSSKQTNGIINSSLQHFAPPNHINKKKNNTKVECESITSPGFSNSFTRDDIFSDNTPLLIFFASGTSTTSKPMAISHKTLITNLKQISCPIFELSNDDSHRILLPVSVHHIFGTISMYWSLIRGHFLFTMEKYSSRSLTQQLTKNKITRVHLTTTILQALSRESENFTCESLCSVIVGGARFDISAATLCKERLNITEFRHMYVTTELGQICTFSHAKCQNLESAGIPLPGIIFQIADLENTKIRNGPNKLGHLLVSNVYPKVWNNAKATDELYAEGGFVKTGDAAYYDEDGYVYIVDRISDVIRLKNGDFLCPSAIESALRCHQAVDDCAVMGLDMDAGQNSTNFAKTDVKRYVAAKIDSLADFDAMIFFVSEIPRTVGGRTLRRRLMQQGIWERKLRLIIERPIESCVKNASRQIPKTILRITRCTKPEIKVGSGNEVIYN
ncbi:AMP-binding enzyme domain-containing protein [Ditylenchus destructor]|nr:AMP-binding enzyme domain-containing protein [Ditylenchus destructor]